MWNITRRGSSSVARSLFSLSSCSRFSRPAHTRDLQRCLSQIVSSTNPRRFRSSREYVSRQRNRAAATKAALEDEAIEGEIEQEDQEDLSETPPSDVKVNRAIKYGPVTKFNDLAGRAMVCQTVVDTITKDMGLETMTQVQSLTIDESLKGQDM